MQPLEFVDRLYSACKEKNIEKFQIKYSFSENMSLNLFEGLINKRENSQEQSFVLEICEGGKIGRFSVSSPKDNDMDIIIKQAMENAIIIDDEDENFFYDGKGEYHDVSTYKPLDKIECIDVENYLKDAEERAYQNPYINKVISCSFGRTKGESCIRNSLGLNLNRQFDEAYAAIYLSAKKGDVIKTAGECVFFDKIDDFNVDKLVDKAVNKAVDKLNIIENILEKQNVVFTQRAFSSLLPKISQLVSGKAVQEKKTKWRDCLNAKVAADNVTIVDNPWLDGGYATRKYDSEGVPTYCKDVIKNGVLQLFLYNLKTAYKDNVVSTGNAVGSGIGVSNFYVEKGQINKEELLKCVKNGVLIDSLNGLHAGFDMVSGDFSFGAEGFEIVDGKIGKAFEQFTVAGNIYQMLKDVSLIADDLEFYGSGFGAPTIFVKGLNVSI